MTDMLPGMFAFFFGLIVGSFLNVCIYRLPRDMSIVAPPSACPRCRTPIRPWENIPLASYLFLRGRCRTCGERISPRYPLVELGNGLLYWAVLAAFGTGWYLPLLFVLVSSLVVITFIDLDFQIIPDRITLPGIAIGLLGASFILPDPFGRTSPGPPDPALIVGFMNSLIGLLAGGGLFYFIAVASRGGMGGGDIKMMAMVGAFMGWKSILLTTFVGSLTGSVVGIFLMLFRGKDRKTKIPFGPFLAFGSLVSLFFGGMIIQWYFSR
ncbi:MAG: prepilin peptidase [Nitrospirales bacterium]|nr:prepilin peptidase [Nitrospirales bacterium]